MKKVFTEDPTMVMRKAVNGMLPKNRRRTDLMQRLQIEA
jgi:ribosomal protein L13